MATLSSQGQDFGSVEVKTMDPQQSDSTILKSFANSLVNDADFIDEMNQRTIIAPCKTNNTAELNAMINVLLDILKNIDVLIDDPVIIRYDSEVVRNWIMG